MVTLTSCPAATGVAVPPCPTYGDGAHRCYKDRRHNEAADYDEGKYDHACFCGKAWSCAGTVAERIADAESIARRVRMSTAVPMDVAAQGPVADATPT